MMPAAVSQSTVRPALCVAVGIPACVPTRVSMCGVWLCGCGYVWYGYTVRVCLR